VSHITRAEDIYGVYLGGSYTAHDLKGVQVTVDWIIRLPGKRFISKNTGSRPTPSSDDETNRVDAWFYYPHDMAWRDGCYTVEVRGETTGGGEVWPPREITFDVRNARHALRVGSTSVAMPTITRGGC
jgi:hypothetical protein